MQIYPKIKIAAIPTCTSIHSQKSILCITTVISIGIAAIFIWGYSHINHHCAHILNSISTNEVSKCLELNFLSNSVKFSDTTDNI